MCCGASAITANTWSMNASGTPSWNRSLIELTNTLRGFLHDNGSSSDASMVRICPVHCGPAFVSFVSPSYGFPGPLKRCACFMA